MITKAIVNHCMKCQSEHIVKNGKSKAGKQKYHYKAYSACGTLNPSVQYTSERKAEIAPLLAIFGTHMNRYLAYWVRSINRLVKKPVEQPMLKDGIICYGNAWGALSGACCRFPNPMRIMRRLWKYLFMSTMRICKFSLNHYRQVAQAEGLFVEQPEQPPVFAPDNVRCPPPITAMRLIVLLVLKLLQ